MIFYVDIDDTICTTPLDDTGARDYINSQPIPCRISKINSLFDEGHEIHYWTARGSSSGIKWDSFTKTQLKSWGCKYHSYQSGKPSYDVFIDDKAINDKDFFDGR